MGDLNTTPRTWASQEIVTAALLNTEIRDALTQLQAGWVTYVPTWTASTTNPTLNNGTILGRYHRVGKTVTFSVVLTIGGSTTMGAGAYSFSLPVTARAAGVAIAGSTRSGQGSGNSASGLFLGTTTTCRPMSPSGSVTHSSPFTWGSGDVISVAGTYEAA